MDRFADLVVASQLVSSEQMKELRERFRLDNRAKSRGWNITDFADFLISSGALTFWQCHLLRNQQFKGFFIDGYKLLDFERQESQAAHYAAEEVSSGALVTLVVYPPNAKDGITQKIAYDVVQRPHLP